jgi:hypothetical protein
MKGGVEMKVRRCKCGRVIMAKRRRLCFWCFLLNGKERGNGEQLKKQPKGY